MSWGIIGKPVTITAFSGHWWFVIRHLESKEAKESKAAMNRRTPRFAGLKPSIGLEPENTMSPPRKHMAGSYLAFVRRFEPLANVVSPFRKGEFIDLINGPD